MEKLAPEALNDTSVFETRLAAHKAAIDADISAYVENIRPRVLEKYGQYSAEAIDAYSSILERGGKRLRGSLVMEAYFMCGGQDEQMIIKAARAVELVHAHFLITDDINDRSAIRRGGPAAHMILRAFHKEQNLSGNRDHFGDSIAMNIAMAGSPAATEIMANLDVGEDRRLMAINLLSRGTIVTAHGQINDLFNEALPKTSQDQVEKVMEWKTAHYTVLNPLHIGMVLAGAACEDTDAIAPFAMAAGRAFQISDDILGIFGEQSSSGKNPIDDIREGKRNIITVYALEHTRGQAHEALKSLLGNRSINKNEFKAAKEIIENSGALERAKTELQKSINEALKVLDDYPKNWKPQSVQFLRGMVQVMQNRKS